MAFARSAAGTRAPKAHKRTEAEDRALEAVRVFRSMVPTLTAYARAVTGNPSIKIVVTSDNGSSDKNTIYFQPPIALGDKTPHKREVCNKRNNQGFQACSACRIRERVMAIIYHEMLGHISQGTFMQYNDRDVQDMMRLAVPLWGTSVLAYRNKAEEHVRQLHRKAASSPDRKGEDFMNLLHGAHPWLPKIWNAIEDARVNDRIFAVRPGVRAMYEAMLAEIEIEGIPIPGTDERTLWRDCSNEFQIVLGIVFKLSGYGLSEILRWNIVTLFDDIKLNELLSQFSPTQTARDSFKQSFGIMQRLNELGFMRLPELESPIEKPKVPPPPPPPAPKDSSDKEDDEQDSGTDPDSDSPGNGDSSKNDSKLGESGDETGAPGDEDSGDTSEKGSSSNKDNSGDMDPEEDRSDGPDSEAKSGRAEDEQEGSGSGSSANSDPDSDSLDNGGALDGAQGPESGRENTTDETPPEQEASSDGPDSKEDKDSPGDRSDVSDDGDDSRGRDNTGSPEPEPDSSVDSDDESRGEDGRPKDAPEKNVRPDNPEDGDQTRDTGAAGEPIEIDISLDPNGSDIFSSPDEVNVELGELIDPDTRTDDEREADLEALKIAIAQGDWFETPARGVEGVSVHLPNDEDFYCGMTAGEIRRGEHLPKVTANDLRRPMQIMRLIFEDNRRARMQRNLKSGKVNSRVLGKRAPFNDPKLFQKKHVPGKMDYRIIIGMDLSGSTDGMNLMIEKNAIYAQAELADGLGIPFEIYGHSGMVDADNLDIYVIKSPTDKWDAKVKERLMGMHALSANLDGHALEFLRKRADTSTATHTIILYYSDGKMPAENGPEERVVLKREIEYCRRRGYTLLGVGIRTDSPKEHGLDTAQLDTMSDLPRVIEHLGRYLAKVNVR